MVRRMAPDTASGGKPTVSVCIPARDEEATIGHIVGSVRRDLVERVGLVDEIIVIDDGSLDDTAAAARDEGATVIAEASILPSVPAGSGKGNVLWKSLHASRGDIVCWVDADIRNFSSFFVSELVAIEGDEVVADFNHRGAGQGLRIQAKVLAVRPATADELRRGTLR